MSVIGSAVMNIRLTGETARWVEIPVEVVEKMDLDVDVLLGATAHQKLGKKLIWNTRAGGVSYVAAVRDVAEDAGKAHGLNKAHGFSDCTGEARAPEETVAENSAFEDPVIKEEHKDGEDEVEVRCETGKVVIEDQDFVIERRTVDGKSAQIGQKYMWYVQWRWKTGFDPEMIPSSGIERYRKKWWTSVHEQQYQEETKEWIRSGILQPITCPETQCKFIPWSCAPTPEKTTPLRLALDFVPINEYVRNRAEFSEREVCSDSLLRWRSSAGGELIDIRKAYLNIGVDPELWRFQSVRVNHLPYHLTRLAFGLSSAPRVLKKVLDFVLKGLPVETFRDDVFIPNEALTDELRDAVVRRLRDNGFPTKEPEKVGGEKACKVLGFKVRNGRWSRKQDISLESFRDVKSLRELAGSIGQISPNHYPVQRWLRPLANAIRSRMGQEASMGWNSSPSEELNALVATLVARLEAEGDPIGGIWQIPPGHAWSVWTDASREAVGFCLQIAGETVEDASFRSSAREMKIHINVRELDAVVLALSRLYQISRIRKERIEQITLFCDNKSVVSWIGSVLRDDRIRLTTMSYVLVENRLELIREIVSILGATTKVKWVSSSENIADELTRTTIPKPKIAAIAESSLAQQLESMHRALLHKGDEIMVAEFLRRNPGEYLEKEVRSEAKRVVRDCRERGACLYKSARRRESADSDQRCHQAKGFNDEVFIDFLKVDSRDGCRYVGAFNLIDGYSGRLMAVLSTSPPSREGALLAVMQWTSQYGPIRVLRCDRGREFSNLSEITESQRFGAVLHPQSQGTIERCHRELLSCIRVQALEDRGMPWHVRYLKAVQVWNHRPHKRLGWQSPIEVWEGAEVPPSMEEEEIEEFEEVPETTRFVEDPDRFAVGDTVLWDGHGRRKDLFAWEPGEVVEVLPRGAYRVKFQRGTQNSVTVRVVNADRLAPGPAPGLIPDPPPEPPPLRRSARIANRGLASE